MNPRTKLLIVGGIFAISSIMIIHVALNKTDFWLLVPGSVGVAITGPWAYYLRAKAASKPQMSDEEIIASAKLEQITKDKKNGQK